MAWEIAAAQSLGGRDNQEDALIVLGDKAPLVLVVADGAGGHADGEKASKAAIDRMKSAFAKAPAEIAAARQWLAQAIAQADKDVSALGGGPAAPRTTIVCAWITNGQAIAGHVGDSRLYHFKDGKVQFRTRDHSVVQLLLDMKRLKESELRNHPDRSRLTKALGGNDGVEPELADLAIAAGDGLALCSDGVWEHLEPQEIATALQGEVLETAAQELVKLAAGRGGSDADNATLILARMR
ncbi:MAG: putative serine/threonine phosphatase [Alphaproteobacteria bacterium]|nr:putative serine/threonine phosphatase [Alphaproteobacteria bacterium]